MKSTVLSSLPLILIVATGCPKAEDKPSTPTGPPPGTTLRIAVVDDAGLAQSIGYLQTEWQAQSGVRAEVIETPADQFNPNEPPAADIVICPAHQLGPAVTAGWVVPLPDDVVAGDRGQWSDIFLRIRSDEVAWGDRLRAVPFGSPVPMLYYRPDLLDQAGCKPPATWADYQAAAEALGERPAIAPLAEGWAGVSLLAHAATYVTHRDNLSTLFRINTMEPLIAGPPFVRALEELAAATDPASLAMDPAAVRAAFWRGEAAMAITWPTATDGSVDPLEPDFPAGIVELPGSPDVYDLGDTEWERRAKDDDGRVPLLASAGRVGVVTRACPWPQTAFAALFWLSGEKWSGQVASAGEQTTLFRRNHVGQAGGWVEAPMGSDTAQQYADALSSALARPQGLIAARMPGRAEYLAALDAAVRVTVQGEKPAQQALDEAAAAWGEITTRLGTDQQQAAYRASLGLK